MTQTNRLLLDVLGKALFGASVELPAMVNWQELYDEAVAQTVVPLVFDTLDGAVMPDEMQERWLSTAFQYMQQNERLLAEQRAVLTLLEAHEIPCAVLKGSSVAMDYPKPSLRVMGDIDLLVEPHRQSDVVMLLQQHGYGEVVDKHHHCHFTLRKDGITVEIHKEPNGLFMNEDSRIAVRLDALFADAVIRRHIVDGVPMLDDNQQAVVLLIHKLEHFLTGGLGLRQLCDWAVFVHYRATPALWENIKSLLNECGLHHFACVITRVCVEYIGLLPDDAPWAMEADLGLVDEVMEHILSCGNFGVKEQAYGQRFFTNAHVSNRLTSFCKMFWKTCRQHWPVCVRCPILLPIAPFVVYGKYLRLRMSGDRPALHPVQVYKSAGAKQQLYKELKPFVAE